MTPSPTPDHWKKRIVHGLTTTQAKSSPDLVPLMGEHGPVMHQRPDGSLEPLMVPRDTLPAAVVAEADAAAKTPIVWEGVTLHREDQDPIEVPQATRSQQSQRL